MEKKFTCKIIRSDRKSYALEVKKDTLIVRAPLAATDEQINLFVLQNKEWIEKHLEMAAQKQKEETDVEPLTMDELMELANKLMEIIPARVQYYAAKIGVTYGKITIRNQRSRWGSCSPKGNLNFNCLLALTPPEVIDSVVVHELCHRKEMNHSDRFYAEVLRVYPDYRKWDKWLKENGGKLMRRMGR